MHLHAVQTFEGTPDQVFPFFADARNLERITPGFLDFRIITPSPIEMRDGATIDYALRLNGIPMRWRSEILDWHPNQYFVDRQLRGPYRKWVHEHRFVGRGTTTEVHDRVEYEVPGPAFVARRFVNPRLRQIFEYRQAALRWNLREAAPATLHIGESDGGQTSSSEPAGESGLFARNRLRLTNRDEDHFSGVTAPRDAR